MSMDTEEMIRAQPIDACIMIGGLPGSAVPPGISEDFQADLSSGCDKTVPAQLMGGMRRSQGSPKLGLKNTKYGSS